MERRGEERGLVHSDEINKKRRRRRMYECMKSNCNKEKRKEDKKYDVSDNLSLDAACTER